MQSLDSVLGSNFWIRPLDPKVAASRVGCVFYPLIFSPMMLSHMARCWVAVGAVGMALHCFLLNCCTFNCIMFYCHAPDCVTSRLDQGAGCICPILLSDLCWMGGGLAGQLPPQNVDMVVCETVDQGVWGR